MMPAEEVKKLITSVDFSQQNAWLWEFYVTLPNTQLSLVWSEDLLLYLKTPPLSIHRSRFRPIHLIQKYERVDPDIISKASQIILNYDDSSFVFNLYFFQSIELDPLSAKKVIHLYKDHLPLLEKIYLNVS